MAGLAEMIGLPQVSKAIDPRRNMLLGLAAGLVGGPTWGQGLSNGFQLAAQGGALDQQAAEKLKAETKIAAQTDTLKNWLLNDRKRPDLVPLLDAGVLSPGEAFNQAMAPAGEQKNPYMSAGDGKFFNWQTGQFVNDPNAPAGGGAAPTVQTRYNPQTGREEKVVWNEQNGGWDPFGGQKAAGGTGELSAVETRQLFDTEDSILAANNVLGALDTAINLSPKSRSGFGSDLAANVGANVPDWVPFIGGNEEVDRNTLLLKNTVTEQALSQLKLVFGGNPTEGERQILIEIQGSVNQPESVRRDIFERAKKVALGRLKFNEDRRKRILGGEYGSIQQPGAATMGGGAVEDLVNKYLQGQ